MTTNDLAKLINSFVDLAKEIKGDGLVVPERNKASLSLTEDLRLDSLDLINFLFKMEERHGIKISSDDFDENELVVLGNLAAYVAKRAPV